MTTKTMWRSAALIALGLLGCVDARPNREGRQSESIYLEKSEMTTPPEGYEAQWLMQTTVVRASSPNVVGDYAFPGYQSDLKLVDFRFSEDALQVIDAQRLQGDDPANPNDNTATTTDRVMLEFPGQHVDVQFLETLNGERSNFVEENTERAWSNRSQFRVDFEDANMDPITNVAWFYGDFLAECARTASTNLVPGSFEFDEDGQHMSFEIEVNYALNVYGGCYDMVSLATGVGTATIHYRVSFLRRSTAAVTGFPSEAIDEKDEVNRKYGSFQLLSIFMDPETGLLDARSLLQRWNPNRPSNDPIVFYFHQGFPERFKPMFTEIKDRTNAVLEQTGATLRIDFREWNDGGIERNFGDIRYSFVNWHHDISTTTGLLGYGPSSADPRTGEIVSANLNLYNIGMDRYRYLIQDYLETNGAEVNPTGACTAGERAVPTDANGDIDASGRLNAGLFQEMLRVMDVEVPADTEDLTDLFLPSPTRTGDANNNGTMDFLDDYLRTLPEYRYVSPGASPYQYRNTNVPLTNFRERMAVEREFRTSMDSILSNQNPFGSVDFASHRGIEAMNDFTEQMRAWRRNHEQLEADREQLLASENIYTFNEHDAINAIATGARLCKADGTWETNDQYRERIIEDVVFQVAIHEFGHNLSLRHNFYGSVDAAHQHGNELSSSVMDYVASQEEAVTGRDWGEYDVAALKWIYGNETVRAEVMQDDFLFCTDQHRANSPLCTAHDLGVTPSQITLNAIERYDWLYATRNRRAYRQFWDTSSYAGSVYGSIFPLLRMWYLAIFDWGGGGVQDVLKRLDQVDPNRDVLSDPEYDVIARDFYTDISASVDMIMAFYDAVINQSATTRNYQTEYDPYYGDVLRLGIITDKLYTTFAFMDMQEVYNYSPNLNTYVAMYDSPFGTRNTALSQRVLDDMLGSNYDTFPWFRFLAVNLFAQATNSNLISNLALRDRIAIRRFNNQEDFEAEFGAGRLEELTREDNPQQLFVHNGEQYIYTYLGDRGWHLVANRSRNPMSFQYMQTYNNSLNASRGGSVSDYGLKTLLAYHDYYNNFSGF